MESLDSDVGSGGAESLDEKLRLLLADAVSELAASDLKTLLAEAPREVRDQFLARYGIRSAGSPGYKVLRTKLAREDRVHRAAVGGFLAVLPASALVEEFGGPHADPEPDAVSEAVLRLRDRWTDAALRLALAELAQQRRHAAAACYAELVTADWCRLPGWPTVHGDRDSVARSIEGSLSDGWSHDRNCEEEEEEEETEGAATEGERRSDPEAQDAAAIEEILGELEESLTDAIAAAETMLAEVRDGSPPESDTMARLIALRDDFDYACIRLSEYGVPQAEAARSLGELRELVESWRGERRAAELDFAIRASSATASPTSEALSTLVMLAEKVLSGVASASEEQALRALVDLADAVRRDESDERILSLTERVDALDIEDLDLVILAITRGRLAVPRGKPAIDEVPASSAGVVESLTSPPETTPASQDATSGSEPSGSSPADEYDLTASAVPRTSLDQVEAAADATVEARTPPRSSDVPGVDASHDNLVPDSVGANAQERAAREDHRSSSAVQADGPGSLTSSEALTPRPEASPSDVHPRVHSAMSTALAERRLGYAYWLARASGQSGRADTLAIVAVASGLRSPSGPSADELQRRLDSFVPECIDGDQVSQVLMLAATLRLSLVAPSLSTSSLLRYLAVACDELTSVHALLDDVERAAYSGVFVSSDADDAVVAVTEIERELVQVSARAHRLLEDGASRTIKFPRATDIWREWIGPGGLLDEVLSPVASDDRSDRAAVRDKLSKLATAKGRERALSEADRRHRALSSHPTKLIAGARGTLTGWMEDAVIVGQEWLALLDRLEAAESAAREPGPLSDLRRSVRDQGSASIEELRTWGTRAADQLTNAAVDLGVEMILETLHLLEGEGLPGSEIEPQQALGQDLLRVSELDLVDFRPLHEPSLEGLLAAGERSLEEAFEARSARSDHRSTGHIIDIVRRDRPEAAEELAQRRALRLDEELAATEHLLQVATRETASARRLGGLDDEQFGLFLELLRTINVAERLDFATVRSELDAVREQLRQHVEQVRREFLTRFAAHLQGSPLPEALERPREGADRGPWRHRNRRGTRAPRPTR